MVALRKGLPGGAQKASVGTSPSVMDLTTFARRTVKIWSNDQDLWLCFSPTDPVGSPTLVTSGDSAASLTSMKADRIAKDTGVLMVVSAAAPYLVVAAVASTATVHVKVVSDVDGSQ